MPKGAHFIKHGQSGCPEHIVWSGMRRRCNSPSAPGYKNYGGRGVKVCARWDSFGNFLSDMGRRPAHGEWSLDRIDVNGDYEPSNCRWASRKQQNNNRRNSRKLTLGDKCQTVAEWSAETGLHVQTILWRLRQGWSVKDSLSVCKFDEVVTADMAIQIRKAYGAPMGRGHRPVVSQSVLARRYGISRSMVGNIVRNEAHQA